MSPKIKESKAKHRILEKAEELFYRQGFQATGINQIIAEAGVAKASFYAAFPSKDDLCLTYLQTVGEREKAIFAEEIARHKSPLARFMCTAELLVSWLEETGFRGCAFLNMVPEVPNASDPIRAEAAKFYTGYEALIAELAEQLICSDKKRYGHLKAKALAKDYMNTVAGGLSLSALHHSSEPMKNAVQMLRNLLKK